MISPRFQRITAITAITINAANATRTTAAHSCEFLSDDDRVPVHCFLVIPNTTDSIQHGLVSKSHYTHAMSYPLAMNGS
jgi:hypothetical protein